MSTKKSLYSRMRAASQAKPGPLATLPAVQKLREMPYSLEEISNTLGCVGRHAVNKWRRGFSRPTVHAREALRKHFDIPLQDWLTAEEREQRMLFLASFKRGANLGRGAAKRQKVYSRELGVDPVAA